MKKIALTVGLLMLTTALPVAAANHLSTGTQATVGHGTNLEAEGNPSVPGETAGDENTPYGLGTSTDCFETSSQLTADNVAGAATMEGLCGELWYNADFPGLQHRSPTDQLFLTDEITTFDVQRSNDGLVFVPELEPCVPFCPDQVGGDLAWELVHTTGAAAGVTDGPGPADEAENNDRDQTRRTDLLTTTAAGFLQRNLGVWEMNGWTTPYPLEEWVGFLRGPSGSGPANTLTPADVQTLIDGTSLSSDTIPGVCGFTPDAEFISTGASGGCEFNLEYVGPTGDGGSDTQFQGYENECNTPSYVCAPQHGAYWRNENVGLAGSYGGAQTNYGDLTVDEGTPWEDTTGQAEQFAVHWMVAPNPPDCPAAEPRFDVDGDGTGTPFLAHDLDIYTTVTETSNGPQTSAEGVTDTYTAVLTDTFGTGLPLPEEATQPEEAEPVVKGDAMEPNYADTVAGAKENSRDAVTFDRGAPGECLARTIGPSDETDQTRDAWVNLLDGQVIKQADVQENNVPTGDVSLEGVPFFGLDADVFLRSGPYGTSDEGHDASNRPGPGLYRTEGKVGVFADKDDDGRYDQAVGPADAPSTFGQTVWSPAEIADVGAYPMVWDVRVEEGQVDNPSLDEDAGCELVADTRLSEAAGDAGYAPSTGLVQAIYLREPTAFVDANSPNQAEPYPLGNNIYVLPSNAGHELWTSEDLADGVNPMDEKIDDLVRNLRTHVEPTFDVSTTPDVQRPVRDLGLSSAFHGQCLESTGGYRSQVAFLHSCQGAGPVGCAGDTVATMYTYELQGNADTIAGPDVPPLKVTPPSQPGTRQTADFDASETWFDVDPLDNDPSRNDPADEPQH